MRKSGGINWKDGTSALVLLALSLVMCSTSLFTLSYGHYYLPGPAFLPFWSGLLLGLMALVLLIKTIWKGQGARGDFLAGKLNKPLFTLLALITYGLLFDILGYLLCSFLFMVFMLLMLKRGKWLFAVGGGFITALSFYLIFSLWLKVTLPTGIFTIF
jgi:putative tricarboxylic transport membrane protein